MDFQPIRGRTTVEQWQELPSTRVNPRPTFKERTMSEVINDAVPPKKRGPKPKYPYSDWLDGRIHRLKPGVDFTCKPRTLDSAIRKAASLEGKKVSVYTEEDGCVIVFTVNKTDEKTSVRSKSYGEKNSNKNKKQTTKKQTTKKQTTKKQQDKAKKDGSPQTSSNASKRKKVK